MATVTPKHLYEVTIKSAYKETVLHFDDREHVDNAAKFIVKGDKGDYITFATVISQEAVPALIHFAFRRYNITGFCVRLVVNDGQPTGYIADNNPSNWEIEYEPTIDDNSADLVHGS